MEQTWTNGRDKFNDYYEFYDFSRPLPITVGMIWSSLNVFRSRCSKAVNNLDERIQALKLLLAAFAVNLVVGLDLWARNCSNVICITTSNTISVIQKRIENHVKHLWWSFLAKIVKGKKPFFIQKHIKINTFKVVLVLQRNYIKKIHRNKVNFSSIKIRTKRVHLNDVDFSPIEIILKKTPSKRCWYFAYRNYVEQNMSKQTKSIFRSTKPCRTKYVEKTLIFSLA